MDIINTENKLSVIMGDMNIDLLQCQSHIKTNDYLDNLFSNGFDTKPTRITSHSATLIDHIYVAFEVFYMYFVYTPEGIILSNEYCITCLELLFSNQLVQIYI